MFAQMRKLSLLNLYHKHTNTFKCSHGPEPDRQLDTKLVWSTVNQSSSCLSHTSLALHMKNLCKALINVIFNLISIICLVWSVNLSVSVWCLLSQHNPDWHSSGFFQSNLYSLHQIFYSWVAQFDHGLKHCLGLRQTLICQLVEQLV